MHLEHVDHIAIAVDNLDDALKMYESVFGIRSIHREHIADFGVEIATLPMGEMSLELLEGKTVDSPIRKFIEKRGAGIHHIGFLVADIEQALTELAARGVELIDKTPRRGKENSRVAFIHPRSTGHVLYELVEPAG